MRINKYLAECGVSSRRGADELIKSGAVKVNGELAQISLDVDVDRDRVTVRGRLVKPPHRFTYIMLHKPKGCITTASDEKGRKTVMDYVSDVGVRLFPVGRLDYDTEGLLLMTNDGDLANKLMHPSGEITKTYLAKLETELTQSEIKKIKEGVTIDGELIVPVSVEQKDVEDGCSRIEITISEGKNREVRRIFESVGHTVEFLKRTQTGEIRLGGLARGKYRYLSDKETEYLMKLKDAGKDSK